MEFEIREIDETDLNNGYIELLYEFTNYKYDISREEFINYLIRMKNINKIVVIYSFVEKKIIGAGTIFKIEKLHNNPVGQIEDVIISEKYRNKKLGSIIIDKLISIGYNEFNCYKIILNCLEKNIIFYNKNNFSEVGVQMKHNK